MTSFFQWCYQRLKNLITTAPPTTIITAEAAAAAPWNRLPDDVIGLIFGNLCTGDRVRMRLVCKSWRSMLMQEDIPVTPEPPWLVLSNDTYFKPEYSLTEIRFNSLSEGRIYRFGLPLEEFGGSRGRRWCCCGSSSGWLLIAGGRDGDLRSIEMFLWNPVSGATRKLPDISRIPFFDHLENEEEFGPDDRISSFIDGVQVFAVGSVECVVAVLFKNRAEPEIADNLALCTPQDQSWSIIKQLYYTDIIFHNGKLYATIVCKREELVEEYGTSSSGVGVIRKKNYKVELSGGGCVLEVDILCLVYGDDEDGVEMQEPSIGFNTVERVQIGERLVESSTTGELLAVSAILDHFFYNVDYSLGPVETFSFTQTRGFEVRRVVAGDRLEKISGVGEQGIFVGATGALCFKANANSSDDGGVEADCIYFATNWGSGLHRVDGYECVVREQGVFHMQHNRLETSSLVNLQYKLESFTGWFTPKLFQH